MHIECISLFPEWMQSMQSLGVVGRAIETNKVAWHTVNPRDYCDTVHKQVDDKPYGGGPGMVLKYEPVRDAIKVAQKRAPSGAPVIYLTPQGEPFTQAKAQELAKKPGLILLSGRYEGIDERIVDAHVDIELSIGDYVLSGGELASLVVADAVIRLLPGVLGDEQSLDAESFQADRLDYPHYTRPECIDGLSVPDVLLSGHHEHVARWRDTERVRRTLTRRKDLIERSPLTASEERLLNEEEKNDE